MFLKKGNLFDTSCKIIAHGVNCRGGFGSGVALQIAKRYPEVKLAYLKKHQSHEKWKLGDVQYVLVMNHIIANMATQYDYGRVVKLYADYPSINKCFESILKFATELNVSVAMPKVGCGLAGGDWNIVCKLLQSSQEKYPNVHVEVWEL